MSFTSSDFKHFQNSEKCHSVFSTALILSFLTNLSNDDSPQLINIKKQAAHFLLSQKSDHWSFNYWVRDCDQSKKMPYPDDLDDTFCALAALYQYNPDLIDGAALANATAILTATEEKTGGPYRTWLVPPNFDKAWLDIDLAVNSNVAYFLSLQKVRLKNISTLTDSAIASNQINSPYYPSEYPIIYFISRWYTGKNSKKLINLLLSRRKNNGSFGNSLDTALAVSALLNFKYPPAELEKSINYLLNSVQKNGSWPIASFYTGINPNSDKKSYYAGSPALSTAFCIEALAKFSNKIKNEKISPAQKNKKHIRIDKQIENKIKKDISGLDSSLQEAILLCFKKIITKNKSWQITLLPAIFSDSLQNNSQKISEDTLIDLGAANSYGWIAYTIYDNFFDQEGKVELLSAANFCLRKLALIYAEVFRIHDSPIDRIKVFENIMNTIDNANHLEIKTCRAKINGSKITLPAQLRKNINSFHPADKSMGHAAAPITILMLLGHEINSKEIKNTLGFFRHYLAARQLNDDAHDWKEDLKMGHITIANAPIFKKFKDYTVDTEKNVAKIENIFWTKSLPIISKQILSHIKKADNLLNKISIINDKKPLKSLLTPIESSAILAAKEHKKTTQFLKEYNGQN